MKNALAVMAFLCWAWPGQAPAETLTDLAGREIVWDRPFTRIISLYPAHTENLFALGAADQLVGVARTESYPPQAKAKPAFNHRDGIEKLLAARPDLILIRPMLDQASPALWAMLGQAGVAVASLQPTTVPAMLDYWRALGRLTGRAAQAEALVAEFQADLAGLKARTADLPPEKRVRVYFEAIHTRMKTFAPHSMAVFVLEAAGGLNLASSAKAARGSNIAGFGQERILALADQIEVYLAQVGPMNQVTVEAIAATPGFKALRAVREGRVHLVDEELVSRPTPRLLEGVVQIGRWLYPGRF